MRGRDIDHTRGHTRIFQEGETFIGQAGDVIGLTTPNGRNRTLRPCHRRLERNSQREIKPVPGVGEKMVSLIQRDCPFVSGIDLKIKRAPAQFFGRADDLF